MERQTPLSSLPVRVNSADQLLHVATHAHGQIDSVYVYAYPFHDGPSCHITLHSNSTETSTQLARVRIDVPCFAPRLVLNGAHLTAAAELRASCDGDVAVFGYYVRSACLSNNFNANVITNSLILAHDTLVAPLVAHLNTRTPLTFVVAGATPVHTLHLGPAPVGTVKHVVVARLTGRSICVIQPHRCVSRNDLLGKRSSIHLEHTGDSVSLVSTGGEWILLNAGVNAALPPN